MIIVGMPYVGDQDEDSSKLYWENHVMPIANKMFADMKASDTRKCRMEFNRE